MYSIEDITESVDLWVEQYLPNFTFRTYQKEYIVSTIKSILDGSQLNIIEAPTGSGKSIIIMIMAGVLDKMYKKSSYILCSDLYLWEQYATAITNNKLYFGKLKGAPNNYLCGVTGDDYATTAPCKLSMIPFTNLYDYEWCRDNGYGCASSCHYVKERKRAMSANVTLLTYQLYLHYMNDPIGETNPFPPRDAIFCDECHNVPNICQQYGSINIDRKRQMSDLGELLYYCKDVSLTLLDGSNMSDYDMEGCMHGMHQIYNKMFDADENDKDALFDALTEYRGKLEDFISISDAFDAHYSTPTKKRNMNKKDHKAVNTASELKSMAESIDKYIEYAENHKDYIVRTDSKTVDAKRGFSKVWGEEQQISYKFASEDAWVYAFLLRHQDINVMLSATVGNHEAFDSNIGAHFLPQEKSVMSVIPSTFDFTKSPIYFIPGHRMSQNEIKANFPINANIIDKILQSPNHIGEKGIIHTGSYQNAKDLYNFLSPASKRRVFIYGSAKEKQSTLDLFMKSTNGVLIGPTLTEGIDLPNDGCRFIVILKIPYPYLGDNLVKAKKDLFPKWYNSETSNNVIQGIGRGNRTPDDWSTTYILDGCFSSLYQQTFEQYSPELQRRFIQLNG